MRNKRDIPFNYLNFCLTFAMHERNIKGENEIRRKKCRKENINIKRIVLLHFSYCPHLFPFNLLHKCHGNLKEEEKKIFFPNMKTEINKTE